MYRTQDQNKDSTNLNKSGTCGSVKYAFPHTAQSHHITHFNKLC